MAAVRITVDNREPGLFRELDGMLPGSISTRNLELGDVVIELGEEEKVIERKTTSDLLASIKDGRYAEQKLRLLANCQRVYYVLEGIQLSESFFPPATAPQAKMLQGAVASLLTTPGVQVVFTADITETARFVHALARSFSSSTSSSYADVLARNSTIRSKKSANVSLRQCFLQQLCQVPGVSAKKAGRLAARYASLSQMFAELGALTREQRLRALADVDMIGPVLADRLDTYIFSSSSSSHSPINKEEDDNKNEVEKRRPHRAFPRPPAKLIEFAEDPDWQQV